MNCIPDAALTAAANFTTNIFTRGLNFVFEHTAGYLINFDHNYETLKEKAVDLKSRRDYVMALIERDEANQLTRIPMVGDWVRRVDENLPEVNTILQDASRQIELGCVANCSFRNWWRCYMLGKEVSTKLQKVNGFISEGNKIDVFSFESSLIQVEVVPENPTVGMDAFFEEVWSLLRKDDVKIMGIYGMGGVGKTTLLSKIHNSFPQVAENKFDVVIWVVVSEKFSIERIQNGIRKNLGFKWSEGDGQNEKKKRIFKELRKRKFVVLLDDLWQRMELEDIGIPHPHTLNNSSKVVFTTRSEAVCGAMDADEMFKVPVLAWDNAWTLFQQKLRREYLNSRPELQVLAEEVAKECGGLPLALVTVARAMFPKKTAEEWKHAINTLKQYASEFSGMENQVLALLKFSYDSLENDTARNCLVYCSLYPEDYDINKDDIVEHWIGEGFLDKKPNLDEAREWGHDIIGSLEAACLLESGLFNFHIKMHDVVRDMALWIARDDGKKPNEILVPVPGSTQAPDIKIWQDAKRVSLMDCEITELPKPPNSPYLLTLILQQNEALSSITPDFFQYMPVLRVLNLSFTDFREIPQSIGHLAELQFLCLSCASIRTLPEGLANLTKLRFLDLSYTYALEKIPPGVIAQLSRLRSLDLYCTRYDCSQSIEEFGSLEDLTELSITIHDFLDQSSLGLTQRLRSCLKGICIIRSLHLTHFHLAPPLLLRNIKALKKISIENCSELKELKIDCAKADQTNTMLLSSLEYLNLHILPKMNIVWTEGTTAHHFKNLSVVIIYSCNALKELSWLVLVPFLNKLSVHACKEIEEILGDEVLARASAENQSIFSRLQQLNLRDLPKLQRISRVALHFPSLFGMEVYRCPLLKKLPFTSNSTKKSSLRITGDTEWWNELEWEDETVETSFQSSFFAYSDYDESDSDE